MAWRATLHWVSRLLLGALFFSAGIVKLANPFLFEMTVDSYQLLPTWGVIAVARSLPWLEVTLGMLLLRGWQLPYFATLAALLLGVFLASMGITYARGIEANCGCFGFNEPISPLTLSRDSVLFLFGVYLAVDSWRARKRTPPPQGGQPQQVRAIGG